MSKQKLVTLIVMMALVMTGLILVQINSIQKSARIREEQFDQTVRQILSQVVLKMEEHERVLLLEEELYAARRQDSALLSLPAFGNLLPRGLQEANLS
ncbi:MAG TPA: hypothetical protein PLX49_09080, partial [Prolixibacteraceae bacterium]|nr:hypothetical protein [Prolixibacteraceae bacterium]